MKTSKRIRGYHNSKCPICGLNFDAHNTANNDKRPDTGNYGVETINPHSTDSFRIYYLLCS